MVKRVSYALQEFSAIASGVRTTDYNHFSSLIRGLGPLGLTLNTVGSSDAAGWQSVANGNVNILLKKMEGYRWFLSLVPELYKRNDPASSIELARTIELERDNLTGGSSGIAERLYQIKSELLDVQNVRNQGALLAYHGRELFESAIANSSRALSAIDPDQEMHSELDASHRTKVASQTHVLTTFVAAPVRNLAGTSSNLTHTTTTSGEWFVGTAPLAAATFATIKTAGQLVVDFYSDLGRVVDGTTNAQATRIASTGESATVTANRVTITGGAVKSEILRELPGGGVIRRFIVTVDEDDLPLDVDVAISAAGAGALSGCWNIVDFYPAGYGIGSRTDIAEGGLLKAQVGDLPHAMLDGMDLIEANTYLRALGAYDEHCRLGDNPYATGRDMRTILSAVAEALTGVADQFESSPVWSAEYWLSGRSSTTLTQAQWRRVYRRFFHLLPITESAARASDQFITQFGNERVGLSF